MSHIIGPLALILACGSICVIDTVFVCFGATAGWQLRTSVCVVNMISPRKQKSQMHIHNIFYEQMLDKISNCIDQLS